jgi:hypothetical protein
VMRFTECLVVGHVPKPRSLTTMRNDVVYLCCQRLLACLLTLHTEGMLGKVGRSDLAPTSAIVHAWITLGLAGCTVASLDGVAASAQAVAQRG